MRKFYEILLIFFLMMDSALCRNTTVMSKSVSVIILLWRRKTQVCGGVQRPATLPPFESEERLRQKGPIRARLPITRSIARFSAGLLPHLQLFTNTKSASYSENWIPRSFVPFDTLVNRSSPSNYELKASLFNQIKYEIRSHDKR